jgi:hypothetical protein
MVLQIQQFLNDLVHGHIHCVPPKQHWTAAWEVVAARFIPLVAALRAASAEDGFEERFVLAGLFGAELELRALTLRTALSGHVVESCRHTLVAAGVILRSMARVVDQADGVLPIAEFCDLLSADFGEAEVS